MSDFWDDIFGDNGVIKDIWGALDDFMGGDGSGNIGPGGKSLATILGLLSATGAFDGDKNKVGYQGKIPRYSAMRDKVPWNDSTRQPGAYGKRYFTDTIYADQPNPPAGQMSIEQARDRLNTQRTNLAEINKNRRPVVPPNFASGGLATLPINTTTFNRPPALTTLPGGGDFTIPDLSNLPNLGEPGGRPGYVIDPTRPSTPTAPPVPLGPPVLMGGGAGSQGSTGGQSWFDEVVTPEGWTNPFEGADIKPMPIGRVVTQQPPATAQPQPGPTNTIEGGKNPFVTPPTGDARYDAMPRGGNYQNPVAPAPTNFQPPTENTFQNPVYQTPGTNSPWGSGGIGDVLNQPSPGAATTDFGGWATQWRANNSGYGNTTQPANSGGNFLNNISGQRRYAGGGIARLLSGMGDGMGDSIPAMIEGQQPAALSHGEMVIPADVVSHLGNGNTEAGAKQFYDMMERVRKARTGRPTQGKQINPRKYLPA